MSVAVVTGGSGHVGANLVRDLLKRGDAVRVLVHENTEGLDGLAVETVVGDLSDRACLTSLYRGADIVFHLAALISIDGDHNGLVQKINIEGARNSAEVALACGVKRYVHCSSIHAFDLGLRDNTITEEHPRAEGHDKNSYDRSKNLGEKEVQKVIAKGLHAVIVNPTGIIGPFDFSPSRMGQCLLDLSAGSLPALLNGGFDWVDVRDVVDGILGAEKLGKIGENYILSGHWHSIRELADFAHETTGTPPPWFTSPIWLARIGAPFSAWWNTRQGKHPLFTSESLDAVSGKHSISHAKASEQWGYAPREIRETIGDTISWFQEMGCL